MSNSTTVFAQNHALLNWVMEHGKLSLFLFFLLLLAVVLLVILFFKWKNRRKKIKETNGLKKDLQIWQNLASLVQGGDGDDAKEARANLSTELKLISKLFKSGLHLIRKAKRGIYDMPWYVLLGEPRSGKSLLMQNSKAGFTSSVSAKEFDGGKKQNLPLCCWLGAKAYILDVSGKVFFDRWLEDSSAEWTHFLKLLCRHHKRMPLNGILLTIPVDALLTDDEQLMHQKLDLITAELQQLLSYTEEKIYCQIIVTKMDMLTGFREYFHDLNDKIRESVFGWENPKDTGAYDMQDLSLYFQKTCESLRSAAGKKMLQPEFFRQSQENTRRIDSTGKLYLFPDSFASLEAKLNVYLSMLFGNDSWRNSGHLKLSGVCFTSSRDQGVTFSERFASLSAKTIDQAVITEKEQSGPAFFSRELLLKQIHRIPASVFTASRQFRKEIPGYLFCLFLLYQSFVWCTTPFTKELRLDGSLELLSGYYKSFADMVQKVSLKQSSLLQFDRKAGKAVLVDDEPMKGLEHVTRLDFYYGALEHFKSELPVPYGFSFSSLVLFGIRESFGTNVRGEIVSSLHQTMILDPLLDAMQEKVLLKKPEPFDTTKREAMFQFCNYSNRGYNLDEQFTSDCLKYLFPDMEKEKIRIFAPPRKKNRSMGTQEVAQRLLDIRYMQTAKQLLDDFSNAWRDFSVYPDSSYQQWRTMVYFGRDYMEVCKSIEKFSLAENASMEQLYQWRKMIAKREELSKKGKAARNKLLDDNCLFINQSIKNQKQDKSQKPVSLDTLNFFHSLFTMESDFRHRYKKDIADLQKYRNHMLSIMPQGLSADILQLSEGQKEAFEGRLNDFLNSERKKMHGIIKSALMSPFFKQLKQKDKEINLLNESPVFVHDLITQIDQLILEMNEPPTIKKIQEFHSAWNKLNQQNADIHQKLVEYQKLYDDESLQTFIKFGGSFADLQTKLWKKQLADSLLALYPQSESVLEDRVAEHGKGKNKMKVSFPLSEESIGNPVFQVHYSPEAAMYLWEPIQILSDVKTEKGAPRYLDQFPKRIDALNSIQAYTGSYVDYWGTYVDKLQRDFSSWNEFRSCCATLKPYVVNTLLQKMYVEAIGNLKAVPDSILSAAGKKKCAAYIATMENRIQTLNTQFSQICIGQLSAWSMLPLSPMEAYREINSLSGKQLKSDYLAVIAINSKCDVPWWDHFFRSGSDVLKKDAGDELMKPLNQKKNSWLRFPLCADSAHGQAIDADELADILRIVSDIGFESQPSGQPNTPAAEGKTAVADPAISFANLGLSSKMDKETQKWGYNLQIILDALLNPRKELVWTLSVPSSAVRQKLISQKMQSFPDAGVRYRYWAVCCDGKPIGQKESTVSASVFTSSTLLKDLDLYFYAFADDVVPTAKVKIAGPWSILRLYLNPDAVYDAEKSITYVPLYVTDSLGQKSLFFLSLKFNKKLPPPDEWPAMKNWPEFSKIQSSYLQKRMMPLTNWNILVTSAGSYDGLLKQLYDYDRNNYPLVSVFWDGEKIHQEYWRYRYMEMIVPGVRTERVQLRKNSILLGSIPLMTSEIRFRFYQHSSQKEPSYEFVVPGEYASLRLLTTPGRKSQKNGFEISCGQKGDIAIPLFLELEAVK